MTETQDGIFRSNEYFFYRKIEKEKDFRVDLFALIDGNCTTEEHKKKVWEALMMPHDWEQPFIDVEKRYCEIPESFPSNKITELEKQIKKFCSKHHFGEEWHLLFKTLILRGVMWFPHTSFMIETNNPNHPNKISILIDSNTSLKELREEFPKLIKIAKQKEVPFDRRKISPEKFKKLHEIFFFEELENMIYAYKKNREQLGKSFYEKTLYDDGVRKNLSLKKIEKNIYEYRKTQGAHAERPNFKETITDREYVVEKFNLINENEIEKAVNNLKAKRKRG